MLMVYTLILVVCFVANIGLLMICIRRRKGERIANFCMFTLTVSLLVLGYLLEVTSHSDIDALMAAKIQYLAIPFVGPFYILFIADITGYRMKTIPQAIMLGIPIAISAIAFTCDHHLLLYEGYRFATEDAIPLLTVQPGLLYYPIQVYIYLCNIAGFVLLWLHYRRVGDFARKQIQLILVGSIIPVVMNLLFLLGVNFSGANLVPVALTAAVFFSWFGITRFGVLDVVPQAIDLAVASMPDALILLSRDFGFISGNNSAHTIFPGLSALHDEQSINHLSDWPEELPQFSEETNPMLIQRFTRPAPEQTERDALSYELRLSPIPSAGGTNGWIMLIRDVTDTVLLMNSLQEQAFTDALTKVSNRRYFMESSEREFAKHRRDKQHLAVIIFDIDLFKSVNDTYGHLIGDEVLAALAARVTAMLRTFDLFARYGGEEFVALITNVPKKTSYEIAERIRIAIASNEMIFDDVQFFISVSIGVCWVEDANTTTLQDALKHADDALYYAKEHGRNQVRQIVNGVIER